MASIELTARRTLAALGIAAATAVAPLVAAPQALADPGCSSSTEPGNASLNCSPEVIAPAGAPSEMEVNDTSPGIASPESPEHSGHH